MRLSFKTPEHPTTQIPDIDENSVFCWRYHDPDTGELIAHSAPMSASEAMALDLTAQAILGTHKIRTIAKSGATILPFHRKSPTRAGGN